MKTAIIIFLFLINVGSAGAVCTLPEALERQYGPYDDNTIVNTSGDTITSWNIGSVPTEQEKADATTACTKETARSTKLTALNNKGIEHICRTSGLCYESWNALIIDYHNWVSIAPAARQATTNKSTAISHYQPWLDARTTINNYTGLGSITFFNVSTMVSWP